MSHLSAIRELLADPARWTRGADARDRNGTSVPYDSSTATCWCLYGALHRAVPREHWQTVGDQLRQAAEPLALAQANDQAYTAGRHEDILALIDRAIQR